MFRMAVTTNSTASSTFEKYLVISGPVLPITPVLSCIFFQRGNTEPVDQAMLPCRTQANLEVGVLLFIAQKTRSINAFVNPYVFPTGGADLSVDIPITVFTPFSTQTRARFCEPITLTSIHSMGCCSERSTYLVAAAWMTMVGLTSVNMSRIDSMLVTSIGRVRQPVNC